MTHANGDDPAPNPNLQDQQWNLIGSTEILHFTATPPAIAQFESTTLDWSVKLPTALHGIVKVGIGDHLGPSTTGTAVVSPLNTTEFHIVVQTPIVSRAVGLCTVAVDTSGCLPPQGISAATINESIDRAAQAALGDNSQVSLRGSTTTRTVVGGMVIAVPLDVAVPDWFDATMDISMTVDVGLDGLPPEASPLVELRTLDVDVDWAWYSDALSLGVTALAGAVADQVAQPFLVHIANREIIPLIKDGFRAVVALQQSSAKELDPNHRDFVLTEFSADPTGIAFALCPLPAVTPAPPVHPVHPVHAAS
jgi:hypothetical protein